MRSSAASSSACRWTTSSRTGSRAPPPCRQRRPRHCRRGPDTSRPRGRSSGVRPTEQQGSTEVADEAYRFVSTPLLDDTGVSLAVLARGAGRRRRRPDPAACLLRCPRHGRARPARRRNHGLGQRRRAAEAQAAAEEADRGGARATFAAAATSADPEAVALVGEALAATHDPEALLPVILQSAIEATGAAGARSSAAARRSCGPVGRRRAAAADAEARDGRGRDRSPAPLSAA